MIMTCAYYQLHALANSLEKLSLDGQKISTVQVAKRVAIILDRICDIFETLPRFYLVNICSFLLGFSYFTIFFLYAMYLNITNPNEFLFNGVLWIFYYSPFVLWMTILASQINSDTRRVANLIQRMASLEMDALSLRKSNILMLQMMHRMPKISCGLFELNWKFFFSILSAIFSFFIILIQFDAAFKP